MTRDELSPEWREKYDALMDEFGAELDALPVPERKGQFYFLNEGETGKPRRELTEKYLPRVRALYEEAEKAMKASGETE